MEWTIFDEWLDITLYLQMKDLIFRISKKEDKYKLKQENEQFELFEEKAVVSIETAYGLHYPGEVLERIGERREITPKQVRALGLAIARTRNLQEENMFIGTQFSVFYKKMGAVLGKQDLFFLVIQYLMEEKRKTEVYEALAAYPFQKLAELLLVLSVFPRDERLWEVLRKKLNAQLGLERSISVYEDRKVYVWLIQHFQFRMKNYRKKDMDTMKYLMKLPFVSVAGSDSLVKTKLLECGYREEELYYLNYLLICEVHLPEHIGISSITAEKLAIEVCRCFLNAEMEYPAQAYELCSQICGCYRKFKVKVNGNQGILDALTDLVSVKNVAAFQVLYPYVDNLDTRRNWLRFDLTDRKWDPVFSWLPLQDYDSCVTATLELEQDTAKILQMLNVYQELTEKDYFERFWIKYDYFNRTVFGHLCDAGVISGMELMRQLLQEYQTDFDAAKEKWKNMMHYMKGYMEHIPSYESYAMLELLVEKVGISDVLKPLCVTELLNSCFVLERSTWNYQNRQRLDLIRPFLEAEEHQELFSWIESYVFTYAPKDYMKFLVHVLTREENLLWLPKEDARAIYIELQGDEAERESSRKLRDLYLTQEECFALRDRESYLKEQEKQKERRQEIKRIKQKLNKAIAEGRHTKGQFKRILSFINRTFYLYRSDAKQMVASYIRSLFVRKTVFIYAKQDLSELFELLFMLYEAGMIEFTSFQDYFSKIEVRE